MINGVAMPAEQSAQKVNFKVRNDHKLIIGILVLVLIFLGFSFFNLNKLNKKYGGEIRDLRGRLMVVSNAKAALQEALRNTVRKRREDKVSLQYERERANALNAHLAQAFSKISKKQGQINALSGSVENLNGENTALKQDLVRAREEKNILGEEKDILAGRLLYFQRLQVNLQKKIRRLLTRTKVELGEVVVKPASIAGHIIKANKKYNFVIVDLGKNDGIKADTALTAYREDKLIGEIKIEKVYDELSVGRASFEWLGDELVVGDMVKGKD